MSVRFGVSGWDYRDWAGPLYPSPRPRSYRPLRLLSAFTEFMELNATFYHTLDSGPSARWLRETPPHYRFVVKAWQGWTHQNEAVAGDSVARARDLLEALRSAGRLEGVLVQFPPSFELNSAGWKRLDRIQEALNPAPIYVELRHPRLYRREVLEALEGRGLHFVNVDFPASTRLPALTSINTSDRAYVRLHGRNQEGWQNPRASRDVRYDHHYAPSEIDEVLMAIRKLAERVPGVLVAANNHFQAQAPAAIVNLAACCRRRRVPAPRRLRERFPELVALSHEIRDPNEPDEITREDVDATFRP